MISSANRNRVHGNSITDGVLSIISTTSPSMMDAVATSGRSVYRVLGKGFHHWDGAMASAMLSWLMEMELICIWRSLPRSSSSRAGSALSAR